MIVAHSVPDPHSGSPDLPQIRPYSVLCLPAFTDNYLWLLHDDHGQAVAVDPGDADVIKRALQRHGLQLRAILLTHHHPDHTGGVAALQTAETEVYGPRDPRVPATQRVSEGASITPNWNGGSFDVLEVPGHTRSHLAYRIDNDLFCGDALFILGCGRLFEGTSAQAWDSLQKLAALPDGTQIHCAHEYTQANLRFALAQFPADPQLLRYAGELHALRAQGMPSVPGPMARERQLNPFLRMAQRHWRALLGRAELLDDPHAAFAQMRTRKDQFQ